MKDIMDKLGENILNTCKEVVDQTAKAVDQTKCHAEILSMRLEVKKLYHRLGKECYEETIRGGEMIPNYPICNKITQLLKEIEETEKKIGVVTAEQKDSFSSYKREMKRSWEMENDGEEARPTFTRTEDGIEMLKFCPYCNIGNPCAATQCINCGKAL